MNLVARLSCLLTLALLLTACSQNPDTGEARKVLEAELENAHLAELLEIAAVENTTATKMATASNIEVSYELEARESLSDYANQVKADESLSGMDRFAMIMALSALRVEYGNFQKGDTFEEQRVLTFRETEKGWKVVE